MTTPATENRNIDSQLFGFLARLWITEPDEMVLNSLREESTKELYESLGGFVPDGDIMELVEDLGSEYCACFIGPKGHLPPHQSVVEQSHFQGECLSSLNQFIEIIGLPEAPMFASYHSMPDHIGIQLGMMQTICETALKDAENEASLEDLKRAFTLRHLAWIPGYCQVAIARTKSDFYRGLFSVTQDFINDLCKQLEN